MSIGFHLDYDEMYSMEEARANRLRTAILRTYNVNKKKANEWLEKAETATSELDRLDCRARGLGVMEANLTLLNALQELRLTNEFDWVKEATDGKTNLA